MHERRFAQVASALGIFRRKQMATRRARAQNLASRGDSEPFPYRFFGFAARNRLRHKAQKIKQLPALTTSFNSRLDVEVERFLRDCR